jgi:putative ABC transport system permease protein
MTSPMLPVAVVSDGFAAENYSGSAVGKTLTVEQRSYEIVGTLPTTFALRYANVDVWLPWRHADARGASLIAKLPPGVGLDDVRKRLGTVAKGLATPEMRESAEGDAVTVHTLRELTLGDSESRIWMLFGAAMLVLLLAAANVATLSVGRALARRDELAVRVALGAGRGRIVRQLIVEASVLALCGAAAGLLLARVLPAAISLAPGVLPRTEEIRIDVPVLLFALAAGALAVALFGVVPAVLVSGRSESTSLRAASTRARRGGLAENALVVAEVAAAFVLSIGAMLLLQTYIALRPSSPGFTVGNRVVADFELPDQSYGNDGRSHRFATELIDGIRSLPGWPDAELATNLPLTGNTMMLPVRGDEARDAAEAHVRAVSAGYLDLMDMEIVRGRPLLRSDGEGSSPVVVVNESAARELWGTVEVVGRHAMITFGKNPVPFEVVGVVRDAWLLRGPESSAELFTSFDQLPYSFFSVVIESTPARPVTLQDVRAVVNSLDRGVPIRDFRTLEEIAAGTVATPRFLATLLGALTLIGVLLAGTGCFAVLSQLVGRSSRELAVRLTVGASARSVAALVLRRALTLAVIGSALGIGIAIFATRVLEAQIYGIERTDPSTFVLAVVGMLIVITAAALIPAARVARLDPVVVMRAP